MRIRKLVEKLAKHGAQMLIDLAVFVDPSIAQELEDDGEDSTDSGDGSRTEIAGPVALTIDWEGDIVAAVPTTDEPAARLAAFLYLGHARRHANGQAETFRA